MYMIHKKKKIQSDIVNSQNLGQSDQAKNLLGEKLILEKAVTSLEKTMKQPENGKNHEN